MPERNHSIVAADALANNHQLFIDIHHINSNKGVKFKAFLTSYSEAINTSYDVQHFVMNQEPVRKLKSTMRQINIGWDNPAASAAEAEENLGKVSMLANMLYPEQVKQGELYIPKVGGSPIFKMRLMNFVRNPANDRIAVDSYSSAGKSGLLGYVDGFNWEFDQDAGFFLFGGGRSLPKNIRASFTYYPVHEKSPAWIEGEMQGYKGYPYPEGVIAYENADRETRGYSSRPSALAALADMPPSVQESQRRTLLKAGGGGSAALKGGGLRITTSK